MKFRLVVIALLGCVVTAPAQRGTQRGTNVVEPYFPSAANVPPRPNIVFIMSDDHAAHAISAYGSRINQTPNIDRLAREGMRFDRCFAENSICTPSRAAILTGKYSHKNGTPVFNTFDGSQPHVAKYLHQAGYYTGVVGKWHLGSEPTGFDFYTVLPGQGLYHNPVFLTAEGRRTNSGYATDLITDLAVDFVKNRPTGKPFFLCLHHKAPHRGWSPDAKHAKMYEDVNIPEPPTLRDDYRTRTDAAREATMTIARHLNNRDLKLTPPPELTGTNRQQWLTNVPMEVTIEIKGEKKTLKGDDLLRWKYQRYIKDYLRCIASVDDNVGRFLDFLDTSGLSTNTVVIYTSDQGFFLGDHGWYDKRFMYEESLKMPFIIRWPGVIKSNSVQNAMALNIDFAPTFLEMAGIKIPKDIQGRSLMPLLRGTKPFTWRRSFYYRYYHDPGDHNTRAHYGVRTETHKLIYFWKKNQWECYDVIRDPFELNNRYNDPAYFEIVQNLKRELYRLKKEVEDYDRFALEQPPAGVDGQKFVNPGDRSADSAAKKPEP
ncbi:MAG TPA: sulfatase [Candidatus Binatia bacterium]|nr:sulfatase [Candidatus Binatia bacterium]